MTGLTALIVVACLAQWVTEGAGAGSLTLGAIAAVFAVFAVVNAYRTSRTPTA